VGDVLVQSAGTERLEIDRIDCGRVYFTGTVSGSWAIDTWIHFWNIAEEQHPAEDPHGEG
jgi:hypothetical protein